MKKIEEVARAIGEAKAEDEPPLQYVLIRGYTAMGYALPSGAAIDAVNVAARAAIEAMREPSAEMIERMFLDWEACHEDGPGEECKTGIHVWRAGINAALNEGRE